MTKFSKRPARSSLGGSQDWMFEVYSSPKPTTLAEVHDNQRLKKAVKRAVERDFAPQSLIDAIRSDIRG